MCGDDNEIGALFLGDAHDLGAGVAVANHRPDRHVLAGDVCRKRAQVPFSVHVKCPLVLRHLEYEVRIRGGRRQDRHDVDQYQFGLELPDEFERLGDGTLGGGAEIGRADDFLERQHRFPPLGVRGSSRETISPFGLICLKGPLHCCALRASATTATASTSAASCDGARPSG